MKTENPFTTGLKYYFKESQLSDRTLQIVEINEEFSLHCKRKISLEESEDSEELEKVKRRRLDDNCDNHLSGDSVVEDIENVKFTEEVCYSKFPIHSIVLCISSEFFKKLLVESGMIENNMELVTLKVDRGQGKYLELLIETFYNIDIIDSISLSGLLHMLDVATRFSCFNFIQIGLDRLNHDEIKSVEECDTILMHISKITDWCRSNERYNRIKNCCTKFLAKELFPLEVNFEQQRIFKKLNYNTVISLMNSNQSFVVCENNALFAIYQWLLYNETWQTEEVIESLLLSIQYQNLHIDLLCDSITVCDVLLNKWLGFPSWYMRVLKYHALSPTARHLRGIQDLPTSRAHPVILNNLFARRHFSFNKENNCFVDVEKNGIIWGGGCITPALGLKKSNENFVLKLKLSYSNIYQAKSERSVVYQTFDVFYSLLPGSVEFKETMLQLPRFVQKFVRKSAVVFGAKKSTHNFHVVAKFPASILEDVHVNGVKLLLFFPNVAYSWRCVNLKKVKTHKKLISFYNISDLF